MADRLARLPRGRDGRPLRARHRLALAAVLAAGFAVTIGPALGALHPAPVVTAATSGAAPAAAPVTTAPTAAAPTSTTASTESARPLAAQQAAYVVVPAAMPAAVPAAPDAGTPVEGAAAAVAPTVPALAVAPGAAPAAVPAAPTTAATLAPGGSLGGVNVSVDGGTAGRSQVVQIIMLMTVLSVAPSLLLLCTSFTKIAVVLSLTRNALGTPTIPPNQVLAGMALFLSLFVMSPVISQMNDAGVQPYLNNQIDEATAIDHGGQPLKIFMANQTGDVELQTMVKLAKSEAPKNKADTDFKTLIPAFVLSELKQAFIIGFVIFIPFLVVDLVVSSVLMSMGMMMLPPVMISLPFKLLLFVMVDGWSLITTALVGSYR